jgi:NSS family neurotransmitter:Na+ symporter
MSGGYFISIIFYLLIAFAAITSMISLLEVCVSYALNKFDISRNKGTVITGFIIWCVGVLNALSFNVLANIKINFYGKKSIFDFLDFLASNFLLPIGGIIIAVFVGYVIDKKYLKQEIKNPFLYKLIYLNIRFFSPVAVFIVLLKMVGIIN